MGLEIFSLGSASAITDSMAILNNQACVKDILLWAKWAKFYLPLSFQIIISINQQNHTLWPNRKHQQQTRVVNWVRVWIWIRISWTRGMVVMVNIEKCDAVLDKLQGVNTTRTFLTNILPKLMRKIQNHWRKTIKFSLSKMTISLIRMYLDWKFN